MAVAGIDINHPASEHYEDKEAGVSVNAKSDENYLDHYESTAENGSTKGLDNSKKSESLSYKQQERGINLQEVNPGCGDSNKEILPDNGMDVEMKQNSIVGADDWRTSFPNMFNGNTCLQMCTTRPRSLGGKSCERVNIIDGNLCKGHSHTLDKQVMQDLHSSGSDGNSRYPISNWNQLADVGCDIAEGSSQHLRVPQDNIQRSILKDRTNIGKCSPDIRKGKERVSSTEGSDERSKEKNGSHESVESNNSKRLFSKGKRTLCIDLQNTESTKRLKKLGDESSCTSLFMGQSSSFLNWITNVTKGFSGSAPKHSQIGSYANSFQPLSQTKNQELENSCLGFRSFVQTLYCPRLKPLPWTISESQGSQEDFGEVKPHHVSIIPADHIVHNKDEFILEQPVPISCRRPDQYHFGETPPATVPRTSSSSSPFHARPHLVANDHPDMCNWGSSSSSIQNSSIPAPNGSLSPLISSGGSEFLGNLWIARLCRKPAMKSPEKGNQDLSSATDRQVEDTSRHQQPHNEYLSLKETNQMKKMGCSSSDNQVNTLTNEFDLPSNSDNSFPKGICRVQKLKSKLNPILPSQRLKKLEPMAAVFAKRLDALRNIKSSRLTDDVTTSIATCFFCGRSGHCFDECSEIKDYERDDLLRDFTTFDRLQKTPSFCMRCFQINHWAVACPYQPGKNRCINFHGDDTITSLVGDCKKLPADTACFTGFHAATTSKKCEDQNRLLNMHNMYCGETSNVRDENELLKTRTIETREININNVDKHLSDESEGPGKHIASCSKNTELDGNQNWTVYNSFKRARIFELVKGLRLSRSDLMRMKSTIIGSRFEGFYLRVRCGKWLDSHEGVDYHVACIIGTSSDSSQGRCHISVDIGGTKCLVDCRVVSNRDFVEDELNAWWSRARRDGCSLPTEEALTQKLLERRKLDI